MSSFDGLVVVDQSAHSAACVTISNIPPPPVHQRVVTYEQMGKPTLIDVFMSFCTNVIFLCKNGIGHNIYKKVFSVSVRNGELNSIL